MDEKQKVRYSAPMMATIINATLKKQADDGKINYLGRVIGYPLIHEPEEDMEPIGEEFSSPPKEKPSFFSSEWFKEKRSNLADYIKGEPTKEKTVKPQLKKSENYRVSFRKPGQKETFPGKEKTLYHLIERNVVIKKSGRSKIIPVKFGILNPLSNDNDNDHTWKLNDTLSMIYDLVQAHYSSIEQKNQNDDDVINEYSLPSEFLIPYLAITKNSSGDIQEHWLLLRIRACYDKKQNKSEIYVYQSGDATHPYSEKLLGLCKRLFTNLNKEGEVVIKQAKGRAHDDSGAHVVQNLFTILKGEEPSKDDKLNLNEQKATFFEETGMKNLADLYQIDPASFWVRHRAKIILISALVVTSVAVALTVFLAPQMTSSAIITAGTKISLDLGFIGTLASNPLQFSLIATGAFSFPATVVMSLGVLIFGLGSLAHQQYRIKHPAQSKAKLESIVVDKGVPKNEDKSDNRPQGKPTDEKDKENIPLSPLKESRDEPSFHNRPAKASDFEKSSPRPEQRFEKKPSFDEVKQAKSKNSSGLNKLYQADLRFWESQTNRMTEPEKQEFFENMGYEYPIK